MGMPLREPPGRTALTPGAAVPVRGADAYRTQRQTALPQARYPEAALSGVLQYIGRAQRALAAGDGLTAHSALIAAQQILCLLRGALDHRAGGGLSRRLEVLYTFLIVELGRANIEKRSARLEPLVPVVATLRDGFAAAAEAQLSGSGATGGGGGGR